MRRGTVILLALFVAVPMLAPLVWVLAASLGLTRPNGAAVSASAFARLLRDEPVGRWLLNSVAVAGTQSLLAMLLCSLGGYALAAHRFRGRRVVIGLLVATALLPGPVAVAGLFEVTLALRGLNQLWAVILPGAFSVFGLFLFAAAYRSVQMSTVEAARLDGCSEPRLWWSIAHPQVAATGAAFLMLHFLGAWNALLWPATILIGEDRQTLPVGLSNLATTVAFEADPALPAAAVVLSILPPLGLFTLASRSLFRRAAA